MTSKTPTRKGRTIAMLAASTLAASALINPVLAAHADEFAATAPTVSDVDGWVNDSFTITHVTGVTWAYKLGDSATETPIVLATSGSTTEFKPFESAGTTAPSQLKVTIVAKAGTGNTVKIGTGTAAESVDAVSNTFKATTGGGGDTAAKFVAPKAPSVKFAKDTTFSTLTIPTVANVTYTVQQNTGASGGWVPLTESAPAAAATLVKVTATPAASYTFVKANSVTVTEWILPVKGANATVTAFHTNKSWDYIDDPGLKNDYVEVNYVKGVNWTVGGKKVAPKPGKPARVKVKKGALTVEVKSTPATGFVFAIGADVSDSVVFTATEEAEIDPLTGKGGAITLPVSETIKGWEFSNGTKTVKFAAPKGGLSTFAVQLSGAGTLKAVAHPDYTIKNAEWTVSDKADTDIVQKTAAAGA